MERYLLTGAAGFVGRHFLRRLAKVAPGTAVLGLDLTALADQENFDLDLRMEDVDLLETPTVYKLIERFEPTRVLHLASFSSVAYSWQHPTECLLNNTNIFLNVIEAIRTIDLPARILSVGSSEEYGNAPPETMPLKESCPLDPLSPYAVARVSQEMLSKIYVEGYGLDIVITRSFNHIGPSQSSRFVLPSFIAQILDGQARGDDPVRIRTGNLEIVRDFTDVRDVVRAYLSLFDKGRRGEVYNVCSGVGHTLKSLVERIAAHVGVTVEPQIDPTLIRPSDNAVLFGSNEKLREHTGWAPQISLDQTLADMIRETRTR